MKSILIAFILAGTLPLVASGQSNVPVSQYGHQNGWNYDLAKATVSAETGFEPGWTVDIGEGRSQIIVNADQLFVLAGESEKRKGKFPLVKTRLLCLDRATGNEIWKRKSDPQPRLKDQESFSGATLSPRATPTILGDNVITVSYTGILECVNLATGELRWKKNLVELGAQPVQFGFSSSPVGNGRDTDKFYVTAAGPEGGLYCLATSDGSTIWKSPCTSFSYATPTFTSFDSVQQILVVTRDEIIGVAEADGKELWRHDLKEKGLTNVPSPIILKDGFIHSGQGAKGASRVDVSFVDGQWQAKERWYAKKALYFYSNWAIIRSDILLGVKDRLLMAINIDDGSIIGKWRGFADGNIARVGEQVYVVDGKGNLNVLKSELKSDEPRFELVQKYPILKGRCWTPPTIVPDGLLLRGGTKLTFIKFSRDRDAQLKNQLEQPKALKLRTE